MTELSDRDEIVDLMCRHAEGMDLRDWALFRSVFTDEVDIDYDQKTSELNLNYIIKEFNARVMIFYLDKRFDAVQPNSKQFGVGLQLQM